jgi:hypothetical protein
MIKVWTGGAESGFLARHGDRGSAFVYLPKAAAERAVSVTMPARLAGSVQVRIRSGEFTSPNGGVKPPLRQIDPLRGIGVISKWHGHLGHDLTRARCPCHNK